MRVRPRSGTLRASWIEINTHLAPKVPSLKSQWIFIHTCWPIYIYIQTSTANNNLNTTINQRQIASEQVDMTKTNHITSISHCPIDITYSYLTDDRILPDCNSETCFKLLSNNMFCKKHLTCMEYDKCHAWLLI